MVAFTVLKSRIRIHRPAVEPDLPRGTRERADVAELDHGRGEVRREGVGVGAVEAHERVECAVAEELLVRVQQAGAGHEAPVVAVVELVGGERVERRERVVGVGRRAGLALLRGERRAHVVVAVDAGAEAGAARHPHRVRARQRREVARAQALGGEPGHQAGQVGVRAREVRRRARAVGERRVAPAQRHCPARAAELPQVQVDAPEEKERRADREYYTTSSIGERRHGTNRDQVDAVARGERQDVGAGDGGGAGGLDLRLDGVDEVEADGGAAGVGAGALLAGRRGRVVQQQRGVAALQQGGNTNGHRMTYSTVL
jgi:hypothetical protein